MRNALHIFFLFVLVAGERRPPEQPQLATENQHGIDQQEILHSLLATQIVIPISALVLGALFYTTKHRTFGLLVIYFGAQSGFNILMKAIFSDVEVSQKLHRHGIPAAFLVTAIQQAVGFVVFVFVYVARSLTRWRYEPRAVRTYGEWASVLCLSVAFALNIGLNNFSLSLLAISTNLIIRSCLPLVTLSAQMLMAHFFRKTPPKDGLGEVAFLVSGVACAALAIIVQGQGSPHSTAESSHMLLGVTICCTSLLACSLNMVFAGFLGTDMKLNPLDTTLYMSVPVATFLLPLAFTVRHPVAWAGVSPRELTDWQVLVQVWETSPSTVGLVFLSGLVALAYNVLQYSLVQSLSATHTAFAGNFNKAATITLSVFLGLEHLPAGRLGFIMCAAILGNIASFAGYNALKATDK